MGQDQHPKRTIALFLTGATLLAIDIALAIVGLLVLAQPVW